MKGYDAKCHPGDGWHEEERGAWRAERMMRGGKGEERGECGGGMNMKGKLRSESLPSGIYDAIVIRAVLRGGVWLLLASVVMKTSPAKRIQESPRFSRWLSKCSSASAVIVDANSDLRHRPSYLTYVISRMIIADSSPHLENMLVTWACPAAVSVVQG